MPFHVSLNWKTLFVTAAVPLLALALHVRARACTAVFVVSGGAVLVGNNEDASMPLTKMWVVSGEPGKYNRFYLGYANDQTIQGGINERGLWFDSFSAEPKPVVSTPGATVFDGDMHDKIMAECATVEEAVELLHRYNLPFLADNMLMLGDRTGASVIVEGNAILPRRGSYQIITNFRQSEHPEGSNFDARYKIAETMLKADPHVSVESIRKILAAVHQEGQTSTVYSYICDLQSLKLYLYHFHNFENVVILDLHQEFAKGSHTQNLRELFPTTFAAEQFVSQSVAALEAMKAEHRYLPFDPKTYADFVGRYTVQSPPSMAGREVIVIAAPDRLRAELKDGVLRELIPESTVKFSVWEPDQRGTYVTFLRDPSGIVTGFVADTASGLISATKMK